MFWVLFIGALLVLYYYFRSSFEYWKKKNVPHPKPSLLFGNIGPSLMMKRTIEEIYVDIYNEFRDYSYVGFYRFTKPGIILREPQLIKDILGKHFDSFHDNDIIVDETIDPVFAGNPFVLKGEKWRIAKNKITPCFTGKKLKSMYVLVEDATKKLVKYMNNAPETSSSDGVDLKELLGRYSTEVVASCGFGLEANAFEEPESLFSKMGKKIFEPSLRSLFNLMILFFAPFLGNILKVSFIPREVNNYFLSIVKQTVKYRKENNIVRNDFLDFMLDLEDKNDEISNKNITALAVSFFTDGFETTSAAFSFVLYNLATNPETFQKLREEVDDVLLQHGKFDFDSINEMKYLDAVVNESLRLHTPIGMVMRVCTKSFKLPPAKPGMQDEVEVEVGTPVITSSTGLHHDPQYFEDPLVYNPDRFLPENKATITKGTFLAFGDGARSCHGQRFALTQIKIALVSIVSNFDVKLSAKTKVPLEIDPKYLVKRAKGGLWMRFIKRA